MSKPLKLEDIKFTTTECAKLLSDPKALNEWEYKFLKDMHDLVGLDTPLSIKQLYNLYKIYFKHVEGDLEDFEHWCREHGFLAQWKEDKDRAIKNY